MSKMCHGQVTRFALPYWGMVIFTHEERIPKMWRMTMMTIYSSPWRFTYPFYSHYIPTISQSISMFDDKPKTITNPLYTHCNPWLSHPMLWRNPDFRWRPYWPHGLLQRSGCLEPFQGKMQSSHWRPENIIYMWYMYMIFDGFLKWGIPKTHIFNTKVTKRI